MLAMMEAFIWSWFHTPPSPNPIVTEAKGVRVRVGHLHPVSRLRMSEA
jgi:hypothetical protein